jgi:acyl-CoA thioesterase-1
MFNLLSLFILLFSSLIINTAAHATQPAATTRNILIFGDSLSAGYGIAVNESWPALLGERLKQKGKPYAVVNASISGETTAGGRTRFAAALQQTQPAIVILELGANDGLQGLPIAEMQANLGAMIKAARQHKSRVLLVGTRLPPNYGKDYTQRFETAFHTLARREKIALLPFLLEPIALDASAFQADGLHPVAAVQSKLLDHVWQALEPLLKR